MNPHPLRLLIASYSLALAVALILPSAGWVTKGMMFWLGGAGFVFVLAMTPGIRTWFSTNIDASQPNQPGDFQSSDPEAEFRQWDEDARLEALNHEAEAEAPHHGRQADKSPKRKSA